MKTKAPQLGLLEPSPFSLCSIQGFALRVTSRRLSKAVQVVVALVTCVLPVPRFRPAQVLLRHSLVDLAEVQ